ncbi:MAG: hypothetical protein EOO01_43985 [Chitinophagaceae bacterium]|nr:MAG: hypothetical protein EOO01_43985 [Chitinophagaceae bacterium]
MSFFDLVPRFAYSKDLHDHLKGLSVSCESYSGQSVYQIVSLAILGLSTISIINYYYGIFNRPSFSRAKTWGLNVFLVSSIIGTLAFSMASAGLAEGAHCSYLHFYRADCILFGLTAFAYNVLYCFLLSTSVKWLSVNNKKVPF